MSLEQLIEKKESIVKTEQNSFLFCLDTFNQLNKVLSRSEIHESDFSVLEQTKNSIEERVDEIIRKAQEVYFVNAKKNLPLSIMLKDFFSWQNQSWISIHSRIDITSNQLQLPSQIQAVVLYLLVALINASRNEIHSIEVWIDIELKENELNMNYYDPGALPETFASSEIVELTACLNPNASIPFIDNTFSLSMPLNSFIYEPVLVS